MYKVLIVEDDPMVAMINAQYVRRHKQFCVAGECRDGKAALAFLEEQEADLLILDVFMPQLDALKDLDTLNQKSIDFIMDSSRRKSADIHPKGIQETTLQCILTHMRQNAQGWLTGDEIAAQVGLTGVTVRRYMAYLADAGIVTGQMNYSTGGRPCMRYKLNR